MTSLDQEVEELRRMNNELAQKMQYWKMMAAQRENEKIELMKEINELRLKLSRLRSGGAAQARKLDTALQRTTENAIAHLVQASNDITHTLQLVKTYMTERQELDAASSQLNNSITSSNEKINRVPPLLIGGRSIQPVVSLRRVTEWSTNHSGTVTPRAVPMHMLQDVYIPLTRIDTADLQMQSAENESEDNAGDSIGNLDLEDNAETIEEQQSMEEDQDFSTECRLDVVTEDEEPKEVADPAPRSRTENPLEGPSWLLDVQQATRSKPRTNLEPDSTTETVEESVRYTSPVFATSTPVTNTRSDSSPAASTAGTPTSHRNSPKELSPQPGPSRRNSPKEPSPQPKSSGTNVTARRRIRVPSPPPEHSPVLPSALVSGVSARRRRRVTSPPPPVPSPPPPVPSARPRRLKRAYDPVLKVVVAKMSLEGVDGVESSSLEPVAGTSGASDEGASPPKSAPRFDAPSPNGATDAAVIVLSDVPVEELQSDQRDESRRSRSRHRDKSRIDSRDNSHDKNRNNSRDKNRNNSRDKDPNNSRDKDRNNSRDNSREKSRGYVRDNSHDSDSSGGGDTRPSFESRTRRTRKPITYKEKPLNRKLRR